MLMENTPSTRGPESSTPLGHDGLRELIVRPDDRTGIAELLVNAALRAGGTDNATALVVDAPRRDASTTPH